MQEPAQIILVCIPYAGGSAQAFAGVTRRLPAHVAVRRVELPGRGKRQGEPLVTDLDKILDDLFQFILQDLGERANKIVLWGHSMGGLLAFLLAHKLIQAGVPGVAGLIVSSMKGPASITVPNPPIHSLPREQFLQRFAGMTSTGRNFNIYQNSSLMDFIEPVLRADITAIEQFKYTPGNKLGIPITVVAGQEDREVMKHYRSWQQETEQPLKSYEVAGGHFFLLDDPKTIAGIIAEVICDEALSLSTGGCDKLAANYIPTQV